MAKDAHLLAAALRFRAPVLSQDDRARNLFRRAVEQGVREIAPVVWVDPCRDAEDALGWLERGAPDEDARRLG